MSTRRSFWIAWLALCAVTMLAAFVFGPFIGPNIVVWVGGFEAMSHLSADAVAIAGAAVLGMVAGGLSWVIMARHLRITSTRRRILVMGTFVLASLAGALAYVIVGVMLYIGILPLCGIALAIWAIGLSALIGLPLLWREARAQRET